MAQHDDFQRQFDRRQRRHHGERQSVAILAPQMAVTRKSRPTAPASAATVDFSGRRCWKQQHRARGSIAGPQFQSRLQSIDRRTNNLSTEVNGVMTMRAGVR